MMVAVVYVLMVPQGLLIITLIIIIHVATRQRCVHAYVPPDTVKNVVNKMSFHMMAITLHLIRQGQDNHL